MMEDNPPILDAMMEAKALHLVSRDGTKRTVDLSKWADDVIAQFLNPPREDQ